MHARILKITQKTKKLQENIYARWPIYVQNVVAIYNISRQQEMQFYCCSPAYNSSRYPIITDIRPLVYLTEPHLYDKDIPPGRTCILNSCSMKTSAKQTAIMAAEGHMTALANHRPALGCVAIVTVRLGSAPPAVEHVYVQRLSGGGSARVIKHRSRLSLEMK